MSGWVDGRTGGCYVDEWRCIWGLMDGLKDEVMGFVIVNESVD